MRRGRRIAALAILTASVFSLTAAALPQLSVRFLNVGQGDAILIDLGELELLIDGGPSRDVVSLLTQYIDGPLEVMVLTHAHTDHYGGLDDVLEQFDVLEVVTSADHRDKSTYQAFLADVAAEGSLTVEVNRGDMITLGNLSLSVLHPLTVDTREDMENLNTVVLQLSYGTVDFLFTGDLEASAENELVLSGILEDIDILKVAHHGSRYGSTRAFLDAVVPEVAIYSAGTGNTYRHPHEEAIGRLCGIGAAVYGTDVHGTVTVTTDGEDYSVVTASGLDPICCEAPLQPPLGQIRLEVDPVAATGQGSHATLTAHTSPGANCTIAVYYSSKSTAAGLEPKVADGAGNVSWTWKVGTRTTPGSYRIVVTAAVGGTTASDTVYFQVLDTGSPG